MQTLTKKTPYRRNSLVYAYEDTDWIYQNQKKWKWKDGKYCEFKVYECEVNAGIWDDCVAGSYMEEPTGNCNGPNSV